MGVFTKLRAFELVEFEKIVLLDLDILILRDVDDLFCFETPAAVFRGHDNEQGPGSVPSKNGKSGINAGVMVLQPSRSEFLRIVVHLQKAGRATTAPEQDYLSDWFRGEWKSLPVKYNYQLHQLKYIEDRTPRGDNFERANIPYEEIKIAHFSGCYGPHDYLFDNSTRVMELLTFHSYLDKILLVKYGIYSRESLGRVYKLCEQWHLAWKDMSGFVNLWSEILIYADITPTA